MANSRKRPESRRPATKLSRKSRPRHRWPICPVTGKKRYGERKDTKLALEEARALRAKAALHGVPFSWNVVRTYLCPDCSGWHLTSIPVYRARA